MPSATSSPKTWNCIPTSSPSSARPPKSKCIFNKCLLVTDQYAPGEALAQCVPRRSLGTRGEKIVVSRYWIVLVTLVVGAGCTSVENALLYHPAPGAPSYEPPPPPLQDLELTMADGTKIHARWAPHPKATGAVL